MDQSQNTSNSNDAKTANQKKGNVERRLIQNYLSARRNLLHKQEY